MPINNLELQRLLEHPDLTDLLINGETQAFADHGHGLQRIHHPCPDPTQLAELGRRMLALADRHLDFANPFADCSLSSSQLGLSDDATFRVHAALAGATSPHTILSIRKHRTEAVGLHEFLAGRLELELWLGGMLERRENFLISGATGAGKTSLLRALMNQTKGERIIALEEVAELPPISGHFVSLQTRQANTEGRGGIGLERLVLEALRMRPDRLLIGEVRGPELLTMLNALNTGHRGAGATIHANSAEAAATRIKTIGLQSGWSTSAISAAAAEALHWVLHVERAGNRRRIAQVARLGLDRRGRLSTLPCEELGPFL